MVGAVKSFLISRKLVLVTFKMQCFFTIGRSCLWKFYRDSDTRDTKSLVRYCKLLLAQTKFISRETKWMALKYLHRNTFIKRILWPFLFFAPWAQTKKMCVGGKAQKRKFLEADSPSEGHCISMREEREGLFIHKVSAIQQKQSQRLLRRNFPI